MGSFPRAEGGDPDAPEQTKHVASVHALPTVPEDDAVIVSTILSSMSAVDGRTYIARHIMPLNDAPREL